MTNEAAGMGRCLIVNNGGEDDSDNDRFWSFICFGLRHKHGDWRWLKKRARLAVKRASALTADTTI